MDTVEKHSPISATFKTKSKLRKIQSVIADRTERFLYQNDLIDLVVDIAGEKIAGMTDEELKKVITR